MLKHESGYFITDPEGLKAWQQGHNDETMNPALVRANVFKALVQVHKSIAKKPKIEGTTVSLAEPEGGPSHHWMLHDVYRYEGGSLYFIKREDGFRYEIGKSYLTGCFFASEVIPFEFIKSPARLALEELGAKLQ